MRLMVAVTGGIGAGKSTVSRRLAELGATVIDSDGLAREVVAPGSPGLAAVAEAFGADVIDSDGVLDRGALAAVVFADPQARRQLEAITHPLVRRRFAELTARADPEAVVVNDIPILVDLAVTATFHLVIGVHAEPELRVRRLIDRGLAEADARSRLAAQISDDDRRRLCDVWMANDAGPADLTAAVDRLWHDRIVPFRDALTAGAPTTLLPGAPTTLTAGVPTALPLGRSPASPAGSPISGGVEPDEAGLARARARVARALGMPADRIEVGAGSLTVPVDAPEDLRAAGLVADDRGGWRSADPAVDLVVRLAGHGD